MKKPLAYILIIMIFFSFPTFAQESEFKSAALNNLSFEAPVTLGAPIRDIQILGCYTDVRDDGEVIFYGVTSGPPALFFAYDVNSGEILDSKPLEIAENTTMAKVSYGVDMGADGILNITTQSNCLFFRYNTNTKELKCYGKVFEETAVMTAGYVDSEDNYYFGTYPNAKLIKYDKAQDKLVDLGTMIESGNYVRAVGGYNDKVFMGGIGNPTTEFVKYDIKAGKKTVLENPSLEGVFTGDDIENFYSASTAGKYYLVRCKISNLNQYYLCVFDMEEEKWIDYIPGVQHLHSTKFEGDYIYFHRSVSGKGKCLFAYNPETKELKDVEGGIVSPANYLVTPTFATLKNQEKYPGRTLIAGSNTDGIVLINTENKTTEMIKDTLPASCTSIRTLKAGINDELIISAYMGSKFVVYDTKEEKIKYEGNCTQIEDIEVFDNKYYFGLYGTDAGIKEFDPVTKAEPVLLGRMTGADQDRAFNIVDAGDKIIWGSYPYYGKLGGAVAVYDKATKKVEGVYKEPVKNQCIAGLAYRNGKIYGSTSVYGGLGIDAIDAPAQMFIMDPATGKVEKSVEVILTTDKNRQYFVGDMLFDDSGNLWVACVKTLLKVNPETLAIEKEIPIGSGVNQIDVTRAMPYCMEIGPDGLLYTSIGRNISAVDTESGEVKTIAQVTTNAMTLADNGNIYILNNKNNNYVDKIVLTRNTDTTFDETGLITAHNEAFVSNDSFELDDGTTYTGPVGVIFAKAVDASGDYTRSEYGVIYSEEELDIEEFKTDSSVLWAKGGKINSSFQYGVRFFGSGIKAGNTYYTLPYAKYKNKEGSEITVYGSEVITFTPKTE